MTTTADVGVFSYTTRFDGNWGSGNPNAGWTYGDLNGIPYEPGQAGVMTSTFYSVPIATARAGNNGDVFPVEGKVIYTPGTYNSAGWALQDNSGGIAVFYFPPPVVQLGDHVQLIGERGSFNGEEQFGSSLFFANLGPGPEVEPIPFSTSDVAAGLSEGWLVVISGTVSSLDCPPSFNDSFKSG